MASRADSRSLEGIARRVARAWGMELGDPFALSRHSYVAPAGDAAVLKVTPPEDEESAAEAEALAHWDGDGAVRLLRRSREHRAILIERARPGDDISAVSEDRATAIAVEVGSRLWRPAAEPFAWIGEHVPRWLANAADAADAPPDLIRLARRLYEGMHPGRATLVHGDLHHHNILGAGDRHLAIDPKPMLGEPEFDVPPFLWNPIGRPMDAEVTERRMAAFAAAGLDERRMRAWTVIRAAYLRKDEGELAVIRAVV